MPADDLETGVLPMEIKKLVDRRRQVKNLMKAESTGKEELMQVRELGREKCVHVPCGDQRCTAK